MQSLVEKKLKIRDIFTELVNQYQLEFPELTQYRLKFTKTKRVMGSCQYTKHIINISELVLAHNDLSIQIDTLKHELSHAIAYTLGECGHGKVWQYWAAKLGATAHARCKQPLNMPFKYSLVCLKQQQLTVLSKQYHKKIKLKGRYLAADKSSLNCLYLVENKQLSQYQNRQLSLTELILFQ